MLYFSSLLQSLPQYAAEAGRLFSALDANGVSYRLLENTRDIWARDFMPVKTRTGKYVSFRYEPGYLKDSPAFRTDFRTEIAPELSLPDVEYSEINLDGGNAVFSPSKATVVISDRVFSENDMGRAELVSELERLLEARVVIIPSLSEKSDLTGHADGMVRFVGETVAVCNRPRTPYDFESKVRRSLSAGGIDSEPFPFVPASGKGSAVGCYINFLDTENALFLPTFGADSDGEAVSTAEKIYKKPVVPVEIPGIAGEGGCLNCISWED